MTNYPDNLTNAISITVRSEYLSYRLLLIHEIDLPKFERINSLDELNTLVAGLHNDWNTTKTFEFNKFKVMNTHSCEGSFLMLDKHRFDYIPRSIYEAFDEV